MASVKDLLIDNNRIQEEQYNISEGKKSYWGISFYENDCMMEEKRFVPSGDELYKYDKEKLLESASRYGKSPYGEHLKRVAEGKIIY